MLWPNLQCPMVQGQCTAIINLPVSYCIFHAISLLTFTPAVCSVNDLSKFDVDFDLVSGRYVIDAKSIMGIFSLDLSKPIDLNIHAESNVEEILGILKPYII